MDGTNIAMHGYNYSGGYRHDFGCGFTQYFYTSFPTQVNEVNDKASAISVYPNPANDQINIDLEGYAQVDGYITVTDMLGREIYQLHCQTAHSEISTAQLVNGMYTIRFTPVGNAGRAIVNRVVIAK